MTTWLIFPCSQNGVAVIYSLTDWYIVIALKFNLGFIILNLTTHSPSQINICFFPYYYFTLEALYKSHIEYTSLSELQNLTFSQLIKRTKLKSVCIPDIQIRFFQYALFNGNYFNPTNISIHSCHMSNLELTEQCYVSVHNKFRIHPTQAQLLPTPGDPRLFAMIHRVSDTLQTNLLQIFVPGNILVQLKRDFSVNVFTLKASAHN